MNLSKVATALTLSVAFAATLAAAPQTKAAPPPPAKAAAPAKAKDAPAKAAAAKPETVKPADLPKAVTDAVMKAHPKGSIASATKSMKNGEAWYTVTVKDGDKSPKMTLDAMGKAQPATKGKGK